MTLPNLADTVQWNCKRISTLSKHVDFIWNLCLVGKVLTCCTQCMRWNRRCFVLWFRRLEDGPSQGGSWVISWASL